MEWADEIRDTATLDIGANGAFRWQLNEIFEFNAVSSVQVRMVKGDSAARGWVGIQTLLRMASKSRNAISALSRMLNRSESQDDIRALLDYLSIHVGKLVSQPTLVKPNGEGGRDVVSPESVVPIGQLGLYDPDSEASVLRGVAASGGIDGHAWEVLHGITKLLLGRKVPTSKGAAIPYGRSSKHIVEDDDDERELLSTKFALQEFDASFKVAVHNDKIDGARKAQLLFVWANVELDMFLRRLDSVSSANDFAGQWLRDATRAAISAEERQIIDSTVCGVTAALALGAKETVLQTSIVHGLTITLQQLHEWLEAYFGGQVKDTEVVQLAEAWLSHETPCMLVKGRTAEAIAAISNVLSTKTCRQVLKEICEKVDLGQPYEVPEHFFSTEELSLLTGMQPPNNGRPGYFKVNHHKLVGCRCGLSIINDSKIKLRNRRIARCLGCNRVLVSLEP